MFLLPSCYLQLDTFFMKRIPEPELMEDPEQALAYARADFSEPHQMFMDCLARRFPDLTPHRVLDLGCGTADITLRFGRAYPSCELTGVDGAEAMLALGREAVKRSGMEGRIKLITGRLPGAPLPLQGFDTVISNSLLHHLADPAVLWQTLHEAAAPGARILVMDLLRPASEARARELMLIYAGGEPEILRRDFHHSLRAAYRPEEVKDQLRAAGLGRFSLRVVSDRHFIVYGTM